MMLLLLAGRSEGAVEGQVSEKLVCFLLFAL
jgi:hypothetical protein